MIYKKKKNLKVKNSPLKLGKDFKELRDIKMKIKK